MIQITVFAGFFLLLLGIGYFGLRKTRTQQDYFIAGGKLGWLVGGATIASTQMSSGLFVGTIGVMYAVGWSFGWVVFVFPAAYWLMVAVVAPRFTRVRKITVPDFIATRYYSQAARVVAAVIIVIAFVIYISAQIVAGGLIANAALGLPFDTGMIGFTVILLAYTVIGGMFADVYSDFIQMIIMIVGAALAVPVMLAHVGGLDNLFTLVQAANPVALTWEGMPPTLLFTLSLAFFLGAIARPEQLVRFYAMRDMRTIRRGIGLVVVLVGVAHTLVFVLALASTVLFPALSSGDLAMPMLAEHAMPVFLGTILLTAVAAAMMSTVDSLMLVAGSALWHDIFGVLRPTSERQGVWIARLGTIVVGLIPLGLLLAGFAEGQFVQFIVALFSALMGAAFLVPVVGGVLWRRATREGAICSMIGGVAATFAWRLFGNTEQIDPVVPGFLTALVLMLVVSYLTAPPPPEATAPFFGDGEAAPSPTPSTTAPSSI